MKARILSQYAGDSAVYLELNALLKQDYNLFRVLVAYTSIGGLKIIEDGIFEYLEKGKCIDWIIGIETGITSKEVLQYLLFLKNEFPKNVRIRIFTAGNEQNIFHPKIYWMINKDKHSVIIGSSNLTEGGLLSNFEVCNRLDLDSVDENDRKIIEELEQLWRKYSTPIPPLGIENLIDLNESILESIDLAGGEEKRRISQSLKKFAHPFSAVNKWREIRENIKRLHEGLLKIRRKKLKRIARKRTLRQPTQLIMDILQETRETQVQVPTDVLKPFFEIKNLSKKHAIQLSQTVNGNIIRTDIRPFISQANKTHRLEIAGIKGLERPLIIKFTRLEDGTFEHEIFSRSSADFSSLDKLLEENGIRKRRGSRRYILIS